MATIMLDALKNQGNHEISTINSKWARPVVNGAILTGGNIDNGLLVELAGYNAEGSLQCKAHTGTAGVDAYIVQTVEEEQLQLDLGEYDYKNFYNAKDEIVRLFKAVSGLRQETSAFTVKAGVTLAKGLPVEYDATNGKFKVVDVIGAGETQIATVVGLDTDFGYNADKQTIRIEYK
jgi:hypothetical protein